MQKSTEANARKMEKRFACIYPHFDFHAEQCTFKIPLREGLTRRITRVALIFQRVDKVGKAYLGELKKW